MNTSLQASGGRHLAPVSAPYLWRTLVWAEIHGEWKLLYVFDNASEDDAHELGLDAVTDPGEFASQMHYVVGRVA
jgi:hypothetical protein